MLNFLTLSFKLNHTHETSRGYYVVDTNLKSTYGLSFTSSSGSKARTTIVPTNKGTTSTAFFEISEYKVTGDIDFCLWNKTSSSWPSGTVITANFSSNPLIFGVV